jgi:hypothetical protein
MSELKPCPCGKTPSSLLLIDNGAKWAYATGDCCNEWHIEFRTMYNNLESDECMALAFYAWNSARRISDSQKPLENEFSIYLAGFGLSDEQIENIERFLRERMKEMQ